MSQERTADGDAAIAAASQRMLMDAGYEPRGYWVYIDDLVQGFRQRQAGRPDLLGEVDALLAGPAPVTRTGFQLWCSELLQREGAQRAARAIQARIEEICAEAGISDPGPGHQALAQRVVELEHAVQAYAERARATEAAPAPRRSLGGTFLAGVLIGGVMF